MTDSPIQQTEKPTEIPDIHSKLAAEAVAPMGAKASPTHSDAVPPGSLPNLAITGAHEQTPAAPSGAEAVFKDLGSGAWNEITQHPGQVLESAGIGLGIGIVAGLAAPEVALGALAGGIAYGSYELYEHAGSWINAAKTVAHPNDHSAAQVAQANTELKGVGAGGVLVGAGIAGGIVGGGIGGVVTETTDYPEPYMPDPDSPPPVNGPGDIPVPRAQPGDVTNPAVPASATIPPEVQAPATATPPADAPAPANATPPADAPAPAAPGASAPGDAQAPGGDVKSPEPNTSLDDVAKLPFKPSDTTMTVTDPARWAADVSSNGDSQLGSAILRFSNTWATQMEEQMAAGNPMTPEMVAATERAADTEGITGSMYNIARQVLISTWKYGPELEGMSTAGP